MVWQQLKKSRFNNHAIGQSRPRDTGTHAAALWPLRSTILAQKSSGNFQGRLRIPDSQQGLRANIETQKIQNDRGASIPCVLSVKVALSSVAPARERTERHNLRSLRAKNWAGRVTQLVIYIYIYFFLCSGPLDDGSQESCTMNSNFFSVLLIFFLAVYWLRNTHIYIYTYYIYIYNTIRNSIKCLLTHTNHSNISVCRHCNTKTKLYTDSNRTNAPLHIQTYIQIHIEVRGLPERDISSLGAMG